MKKTSSIFYKILVSLTGLFLSLFLIIHLIGNLQLLKNDQGLSFNKYAVFMTTNPLIMTVSWLLYATILFHAFNGLWLAWKNKKARSVSYAKYANNSKWYSRNMGILGTIILIFIVVHMSNFWFEYKFGYTPYSQYNENIITGELTKLDVPEQNGVPPINGKMEELVVNTTRIIIVKDLYKSVATAFEQELWIVILYVISMIAIAFHLLHGFQSAFHTLGINNRYILLITRLIGIWGFAILIPLGFAIIPLYMYFAKMLF